MYPMERSGRLSRMRPMASIPITRATTSQRMRRFCVNIEANGSSFPPVRRRRRRFVRTIAMPMPSMMYSNPYEQVVWNCHDTYGEQQRLSSGQDFSIFRTEMIADENTGDISNSSQATLCNGSPRQETSYSVYENKSDTQNTINQLKSIVAALERNVQSEEPSKPKDQSEATQGEKSCQSSQLHILTDLMRETNEKLDAFISNQVEQHAAMVSSSPLMQMNLLGKLKGGGRMCRNLPVLPLFVQTMTPPAPMSALPPLPSPPNPMEGNDSFKNRQRLYHTPPQRDTRRRRRPLRSAYIHLENRSCSTDDLEMLPRILLARSPAGNEAITQDLRDCGTTMWCPMKCCCQHFSGVPSTDGNTLSPLEEKDKIVTPVPYPMQPSPRTIETSITYEDDTPPPLPKTPPPTHRLKQEEDYQVDSRCYAYSMEGSSSCSSCQELSYNCMENRQQDDQYDCHSNLDVIEQYYRERQTDVPTSNKRLQTEIDSTASTTSTSDIHQIIATTDKAVSTTELQNRIMKPIIVVTQCKNSSLKPQHEKRVNQKPLSRNQIKVKFERKSASEEKPKVSTQNRMQKLKTHGEAINRKSAGKQEESAWYRVAGDSNRLPAYKSYPTCWN